MSKSELTKQALAEALIVELETRRLDRITVTDVSNRCGISRQAFYYHFHDVYDLAVWICEREARTALDEVPTCDYDTWQQGLLAILRLLRRRRDLVMRAIHAIDPTYIHRFLHAHVGKLVLHVVEDASATMRVAPADKEFVAQFYTAGLINVVYTWFIGGMRDEPEELVARLNLLVQGNIVTALARFADA